MRRESQGSKGAVMTISDYILFTTVAKFKSLTMAADSLHLTKSAVSHALNKMEKEIGFPLFIRTNKDVRITSEGEDLLPLANEIIMAHGRFEDQIRQLHDVNSGVIRIGTYTSVCLAWMPDIIRTFKEKYPGIEIELHVGANNSQLRDLLKNKEIDIAIGTSNLQKGLSVTDLYKDEMVCIVHKDFHTINKTYVTAEELIENTLLLQEGPYGEEVFNVLSKLGINASSYMISYDDASLLAMAESGLGYTIQGRLTLETSSASVSAYPFNPRLYRHLAILRNPTPEPSPAVIAMMEHIKSFVDGIKISYSNPDDHIGE